MVIRTSSELVYRGMSVLRLGHVRTWKLLYMDSIHSPIQLSAGRFSSLKGECKQRWLVMPSPKYGSAHIWEITWTTGWAKPDGRAERLLPQQVHLAFDWQWMAVGRFERQYCTSSTLCTVSQQQSGTDGELVSQFYIKLCCVTGAIAREGAHALSIDI